MHHRGNRQDGKDQLVLRRPTIALTLLTPDIVAAILDWRHPTDMTLVPFQYSWNQQLPSRSRSVWIDAGGTGMSYGTRVRFQWRIKLITVMQQPRFLALPRATRCHRVAIVGLEHRRKSLDNA
jgi:hypothetical protein